MIYLQRSREPIERDQSAMILERAYMKDRTRWHVFAFSDREVKPLQTAPHWRIATWPAWFSNKPKRNAKTVMLNGWRQPVTWLPDAESKP